MAAYSPDFRDEAAADVKVDVLPFAVYSAHTGRWSDSLEQRVELSLPHHTAWLSVLRNAMGHVPYCLEASAHGHTEGILPLVLVRSPLFGRFLVSLPYLNSGGVLAERNEVASALVDRAVALAHELRVRYLELRHETALEHRGLNGRLTSKVHMRLALPRTHTEMWKQLKDKVRSQIRKGQKQGFHVVWGGRDLVSEFYAVFSRNMRDLGTPVYGRALFEQILEQFPGSAELCVVRRERQPVAVALLMHGETNTEVPSASSLRQFNPTNVNMLMYWHLLMRAIERGRRVFDFGRSTTDSPTYRFKKQWGAEPEPAVWQYFVRQGSVGDMRPENPSYGRLIRIWQHLPVSLTRIIGPMVVRGIP